MVRSILPLSFFFFSFFFLGVNRCFRVSAFFIQSTCARSDGLAPTCMPTLRAASDKATVDLTSDGGVLVFGTDVPSRAESKLMAGTKFIIAYRGFLEPSDWTADEVVTCWLKEQQGLDDLGDVFVANNINETTLTNPDIFTEQYVMENLGMENSSKIKVKKLVMAAKRLANTREDCKFGDEFDWNDAYEIYWHQKPKLIPGMVLALEYMLGLNLDHVEVKCRSDYAYGADGYRKRTGEVLIPPFTSLRFEIDLVESSSS